MKTEDSIRDIILEETVKLDKRRKLLADMAYQLKNGLTGEDNTRFSMELEIVMFYHLDNFTKPKDFGNYIIQKLNNKK